MFTNLINDLVDRFSLIKDLGYSLCYRVNEETGCKHLVHALHSANEGLPATTIINMSSEDFRSFINQYVN